MIDREMNDIEQHKAIAEAYGWTQIAMSTEWYGSMFGKDPNDCHDKGLREIPNYLYDLNAIRQVEKTLWHDPKLVEKYMNNILNVYRKSVEYIDSSYWFMCTAKTRAEALLITIGKLKG